MFNENGEVIHFIHGNESSISIRVTTYSDIPKKVGIVIVGCLRKTVMAQVPNVEKAYEGQDTRLLNAARNGEVNKISELIKQGVNVNETDKNGCTPLIFASASGHVETVRILLSAGAEVKIKDNLGYDAYTAAMFSVIIRVFQ